MSKSVLYTSSPLLASKTPVWRSKFIVAAIALGFVGLAGRAAYIQVFGNAFFQRQGEVRFARTLELPANRGRILDRFATQVLAASWDSVTLLLRGGRQVNLALRDPLWGTRDQVGDLFDRCANADDLVVALAR